MLWFILPNLNGPSFYSLFIYINFKSLQIKRKYLLTSIQRMLPSQMHKSRNRYMLQNEVEFQANWNFSARKKSGWKKRANHRIRRKTKESMHSPLRKHMFDILFCMPMSIRYTVIRYANLAMRWSAFKSNSVFSVGERVCGERIQPIEKTVNRQNEPFKKHLWNGFCTSC